MKKAIPLFSALILFGLLPAIVKASGYDTYDAEVGAAAAGITGLSFIFICGFYLVIFAFAIAMIGLWIYLCMWVYKDAKIKSPGNEVMWLLVVLIGGWIGLLIYILVGRNPK